MARIKFEIDKGHLGAKPEIKFTKDDQTMAKMSIAVNRYRKDRDGEWEQVGETSWVHAVAFGYVAEQIEMMELDKGDAVFASGHMFQNTWVDEDDYENTDWNFNLDRLYPIPKVFENDRDDDDDDRPRRGKSSKRRSKSGKRRSSGKSSSRKSSGDARSRLKTKAKKGGSSSSDRIKQIMKQLGR